MYLQQAKRAGLGWPGRCRPAGSPDLLSGPSARARAWNGHPGFRAREKASDWIQTGPGLILGKHPMTTHQAPSSSDTRPNFRISGSAHPVAAPTVSPCPAPAAPRNATAQIPHPREPWPARPPGQGVEPTAPTAARYVAARLPEAAAAVKPPTPSPPRRGTTETDRVARLVDSLTAPRSPKWPQPSKLLASAPKRRCGKSAA